eukprot:GDKK01023046.1.p3 GENE.GDKK01023046.1~~GDKK01023046.1.p3  ORF type:complete len:100 (-),score=21.14 GDKK01023046.1:256-555(-)
MEFFGLLVGGREKVPAAFCRKAVVSTKEFEVWGDGKQTRSFMFIDDCVEGSIRMLLSDCAIPLNLGTRLLHSFVHAAFYENVYFSQESEIFLTCVLLFH